MKLLQTVFACILIAGLAIAAPSNAATYTVTTTADTGACTEGVVAPGCSLREAITAANANVGPDHIHFNIPSALADPVHGKFTITPQTNLPEVLDTVQIDATTQPPQPGITNEPLIELSGLGGADRGLQLVDHFGSSMKGFIANNFSDRALYILLGGGHTISGNWVGTDATGTQPRPNRRSIFLWDTSGNCVGKDTQHNCTDENDLYYETEEARNIVSGNSDETLNRKFGIFLVFANNNFIEGNWVGLDKTGLTALPNNGEGIDLVFSNNNVVGGSEAARNIISATQKQQAIQVEDAGGNEISYNCLGTNKDCEVDQASYDTSPFANGFVSPHDTIDILSFDPNRNGNENKVLYNVVAQNGVRGIAVVSIDVGGGNTMSDTVVEGNTFINSRFDAINIITDGASSVLDGVMVRGNIINNKTLPLDGSVSGGILANGIINDLLIEDNTISNLTEGIILDTAQGPNPDTNRMEDILLKGNRVRDSLNEGIIIKGIISNVSVIDNEITGNGSHGIAALASTKINVESSLDNVGIENGLIKDNQIYNNGGIGVYLDATLNFSLENILEIELFSGVFETGDFDFVVDEVSTDYALYEIRNDSVTNGSDDDFDLLLFTDTFDLIAAPFLSGSDEQIPVLFKPGTYIVAVEAYQVGTVADPFSSFIAYKTTADIVSEVSNRPHNIEMSGNAIYGNGGLGIDLSNKLVDGVAVPDGVTADMEAANGPNGLQNFPELLEAKFVDSAVQVKGNLNSKPRTTYRLEFFANSEVDASGNGEGERPLGTKLVSTNANGLANNFVTHLSDENVNAGDYITATATDVDTGRTSEFSMPVSIRILKHSK